MSERDCYIYLYLIYCFIFTLKHEIDNTRVIWFKVIKVPGWNDDSPSIIYLRIPFIQPKFLLPELSLPNRNPEVSSLSHVTPGVHHGNWSPLNTTHTNMNIWTESCSRVAVAIRGALQLCIFSHTPKVWALAAVILIMVEGRINMIVSLQQQDNPCLKNRLTEPLISYCW